jgi:hypothetical protein
MQVTRAGLDHHKLRLQISNLHCYPSHIIILVNSGQSYHVMI